MNKWDYRFISLTKEVASWSKEGKQVGCVIVDSHTHKVLSTGFNGLPKYMNDDCLSTLSKEDKAVIVYHAEHNALEHLSPTDYNKEVDLYVTKTPCMLCSIKMVHAHVNIKRIFYIPSENEEFNKRYNVQASLDYLNQNGIETIPIQYNKDNTTTITLINYLSNLKEEILVDEINDYVNSCVTLIDNLDDVLKYDTSKIDAIIRILETYNYKNILRFVKEYESVSAELFLKWYKTF